MDSYNSYQNFIKPSFAPPSWIFGPVWSVLYLIIAVSFGSVFLKIIRKEIPLAVGVPFVLNLLFNFLFTYLQFGLKNNFLASIDIILVLTTLGWAMYVIFPFARWITYANIPYFVWVSFATVVQFSITYLNR